MSGDLGERVLWVPRDIPPHVNSCFALKSHDIHSRFRSHVYSLLLLTFQSDVFCIQFGSLIWAIFVHLLLNSKSLQKKNYSNIEFTQVVFTL